MSEFNAGDIVYLKSGGPNMTIKKKTPRGEYQCRWFVNGELKEEFFIGDEITDKERNNPYILTDEDVALL